MSIAGVRKGLNDVNRTQCRRGQEGPDFFVAIVGPLYVVQIIVRVLSGHFIFRDFSGF